MTSIHKNLHCVRIYWNCEEIPGHERGHGNLCIEPWKCSPASHCQLTLITPYTEPNGLIITTTIVNENLERWSDRINSHPKGHGHPRVALAGIKETATCVNSKIHVSQVAVNVDGVTNHTKSDCGSTFQRAIQGSNHHSSLSYVQRKCHHGIYRTQR